MSTMDITKATPHSRKTALIMLVLTAAYLVFELGFNARLLDVVGGHATHEEVDRIEKYGRIISGVALTLLFWGFQIKKSIANHSPAFLIPKLALTALVVISAVFFGQKALIDFFVDNSSAVTRARASVLVPISQLIRNSEFDLAGMDVPISAFGEPEGKTFVATFALQALAVPNLYDKLKGQEDEIFRLSIESVRGTADKSFADYQESVRALASRYSSEYLPGVQIYQREIAHIPERQRVAWRDYTEKLEYRTLFGGVKRISPSQVPRHKWPEVRAKVQAQNIPVGSDWRPDDQGGFNAAIDSRVRSEAAMTFRQRSVAALGPDGGEGLAPNLTFDQWTAAPAIQQQWQKKLHVSLSMHLEPRLSATTYDSRIYAPTVAAAIAVMKAERMAPVEQYADGGARELIGKDSARALMVPPIALTFSLLGALTHILKCLLFAAKIIVTFSGRALLGITALYLGAILVLPFGFPNQITQQKLITTLADHTFGRFGAFNGTVLNMGSRWVMQMQKYFYPVNEGVRVVLLRDFRYGYDRDKKGARAATAAQPISGKQGTVSH